MPNILGREFPDLVTFVAMPAEEVAGLLLQIAATERANRGGKIFHPGNLNSSIVRVFQAGGIEASGEEALQTVLSEGWSWLTLQMLIVAAPGMNGNSGWQILSRAGEELLRTGKFAEYRRVTEIPRSFIHSAIGDLAWPDLVRQDYSTAVFKAFRQVEIAIRSAAVGLDPKFTAVQLARAAFHPETGPLRDPATEAGERQALMELFAGSLGSYKNPHSHRNVQIATADEAIEMIVLASHLLRIVEARQLR